MAGAFAASAAAQDHSSIGQRPEQQAGGTFNVKAHGAAGDGTTLDSPAINRAIEAAADFGGGTVHFPAGQYLCFSIRPKSNVALHLDQGAVIIAAGPPPEGQTGGYDEPEPAQPWESIEMTCITPRECSNWELSPMYQGIAFP